MRTKVKRSAPRDYPTLMAMLAILLGVAVIIGIISTYSVRQSTDDIGVRISIYRQLPSDL
jgi:hypothetical protein